MWSFTYFFSWLKAAEVYISPTRCHYQYCLLYCLIYPHTRKNWTKYDFTQWFSYNSCALALHLPNFLFNFYFIFHAFTITFRLSSIAHLSLSLSLAVVASLTLTTNSQLCILMCQTYCQHFPPIRRRLTSVLSYQNKQSYVVLSMHKATHNNTSFRWACISRSNIFF